MRIEHLSSAELSPDTWTRLIRLCDAAYEESTAEYFANIGPGEHLLGWEGDELVSHLMWVPRFLQAGSGPTLSTAYVEMVATASAWRNRGLATQLLEELPALLGGYEIAALAPATDNLYLRLGWRLWMGPLLTRHDGALVSEPEERVMLLALPGTPNLVWEEPLSIEWRPGEVW